MHDGGGLTSLLLGATARRTRRDSVPSCGRWVGLSEPAAASNQPSIIVESTPAPNATVTVSEMTIDIHFNTKIDHHHSRLVLVLPNDRLLDLPANMAAAPDHLSGRVSSLTPGSYTLRWQALPVGKKLVKGEIPFTVK